MSTPADALTVGSLFSGIGGLDLGLERAGMRVVWQSEIDPYACRVLARHWPDVPNLGDITAVDWSIVERPDLICGGYPCQPFSLAGTRNGENDPRHLWPHFRRALRDLRPRWALLENVPGHLSLGFGRVLADLADLGYDTEWDCIPAAAVGAPHLRYRVFVVADADGGRREGLAQRDVITPAGLEASRRGDLDRLRLDVADADDTGRREQRRPESVPAQLAAAERSGEAVADTVGPGHASISSSSSTRSCRPSVRPGDGHPWAVEPNVGRVADGVPARVDRLRTLGNAVVPQVAEWIGRRIVEAVA